MKRYCRLGRMIAWFLLMWTGLWAHAETRVVFTVDVESNDIPLPTQVDALCSDGSECGLTAMVRMLKRYGWAGTFFVNVYEYRQWGETSMRSIVTKLQAAGQDVALHTHPQWAYDPSRWAMYQYNPDEQKTIIRDGVQLLERWTGHPVVAHRAGAYAADQHTLDALAINGIRIDSSLFWGHPWSRVNGTGLLRNRPSSWGHLTEIPVTVYQREDRPPLLGGLLTPAISIRKIDPDWFLSKEEAVSAIDAVTGADLPFLVVFLHSFSFMESQNDEGVPTTNRRSLDIFIAMLDHIAKKGLPVVTLRSLAGSLEPLPIGPPDQDLVPGVTVRVDLHRYLWHRVKTAVAGGLASRQAVSVALTIGVLLLLGRIALLMALRRRSSVARAKR